jgi:hypothetical protein
VKQKIYNLNKREINMLEQKFNGKTCLHKVRAKKQEYVESEERCRNNCPNDERCSNYIPLERTQERYAYLNLYKENE